MNRLSHRSRIVISAVTLMLVAHIIFIFNGYVNITETRNSINNQMNTGLFNRVEYNAQSMLKEIDSFSNHLKTSEFTTYSNEFWNLRDSRQSDVSRNELNERINSLQFSPDLVEKIYILGADHSQKNFTKIIGSDSWSDENTPSIEDLEDTGFMDPLNAKGTGIPMFFQTGELSGKVHKKWKTTTEEQIARVLQFSKKLEGKLIINSGVNSFTVELIIISPHLITHFMPKEIMQDKYMSIFTQDYHLIWSNFSDSSMLMRFVDSFERTTNEEQILRIGGNPYSVNKKTLTPYGIVVTLFTPLGEINKAIKKTMVLYILLSVVLLLVTFFISYLMSGFILKPIGLLSNNMKNTNRSFPLKTMPDSIYSKRFLSSLPIRTKLFYLFTAAILVPSLSAVFFYSEILNSFTKAQWNNIAYSTSKQMNWSLHNQIQSYENIINLLSVNKELQSALLPFTGNLQQVHPSMEGPMFNTNIYPELGEVSYFALYDLNGYAQYSSVFSNNLSLFSLDVAPVFIHSKKDLIWLPASLDVFNHSTIKIMKKIYNISGNAQQNNLIGYIQMVLKPNAFSAVGIEDSTHFTISDTSGNILYSNVQDQSALGVQPKYMNVVELIPETNWKITTYYPLDGITSLNNELLMVLALVSLLCFVISILLSGWLVKPLMHLQFTMDKIGNGNLLSHFSYRANDEVGTLVNSFNQMIIQINQLMQENINSKTREQELIALKSQAELSMLQQQINPHFLYNTLESINMEAQRNNGTMVTVMVSALAKLFRYSISSGPEEVLLETEIENTRNYVTIQQIRFPDRFTVTWEIDESAMSCLVLKFIFQPIVENAINHGLSEYSSGGELGIYASIQNHQIVLQVSDNGVGMRRDELDRLIDSMEQSMGGIQLSQAAEKNRHSRGFGLKNVYSRLKLYYGSNATITINSKPMKGTSIRIIIPYNAEVVMVQQLK